MKAIPTKPPTTAEIIIAIQELNRGKAPDIEVTPEVLKIDPKLTAKISETLLKQIWEREVLPDE
jgi:hypothetical protein